LDSPLMALVVDGLTLQHKVGGVKRRVEHFSCPCHAVGMGLASRRPEITGIIGAAKGAGLAATGAASMAGCKADDLVLVELPH